MLRRPGGPFTVGGYLRSWCKALHGPQILLDTEIAIETGESFRKVSEDCAKAAIAKLRALGHTDIADVWARHGKLQFRLYQHPELAMLLCSECHIHAWRMLSPQSHYQDPCPILGLSDSTPRQVVADNVLVLNTGLENHGCPQRAAYRKLPSGVSFWDIGEDWSLAHAYINFIADHMDSYGSQHAALQAAATFPAQCKKPTGDLPGDLPVVVDLTKHYDYEIRTIQEIASRFGGDREIVAGVIHTSWARAREAAKDGVPGITSRVRPVDPASLLPTQGALVA